MKVQSEVCSGFNSCLCSPGFRRKEFRGKLAIAITANFINRNTTAEAKVEEISGVAFIFNQKFFQDLKEETGGCILICSTTKYKRQQGYSVCQVTLLLLVTSVLNNVYKKFPSDKMLLMSEACRWRCPFMVQWDSFLAWVLPHHGLF